MSSDITDPNDDSNSFNEMEREREGADWWLTNRDSQDLFNTLGGNPSVVYDIVTYCSEEKLTLLFETIVEGVLSGPTSIVDEIDFDLEIIETVLSGLSDRSRVEKISTEFISQALLTALRRVRENRKE